MMGNSRPQLGGRLRGEDRQPVVNLEGVRPDDFAAELLGDVHCEAGFAGSGGAGDEEGGGGQGWKREAGDSMKSLPPQTVNLQPALYSRSTGVLAPLTTSLRPMKSLSWRTSTARLASSTLVMVTKPKPLDFSVCLWATISALTTAPTPLKRFERSLSVASKERLPT